MKKPPIRERLRLAEAEKSVASRILSALLTGAGGEIRIPRSAFNKPAYGGTEVLVRENEIVVRGQPKTAQ